jgi:hypothetical protein
VCVRLYERIVVQSRQRAAKEAGAARHKL